MQFALLADLLDLLALRDEVAGTACAYLFLVLDARQDLRLLLRVVYSIGFASYYRCVCGSVTYNQ